MTYGGFNYIMDLISRYDSVNYIWICRVTLYLDASHYEFEKAVPIVSWHDATVCLRDTWHSAGPCDVTVMGDAGRVIECHPNWDQTHTTRRPPFCHQHWDVALKSYSLKLKINYLWYDFPFPLTIVAVIMACVAVAGHRHRDM